MQPYASRVGDAGPPSKMAGKKLRSGGKPCSEIFSFEKTRFADFQPDFIQKPRKHLVQQKLESFYQDKYWGAAYNKKPPPRWAQQPQNVPFAGPGGKNVDNSPEAVAAFHKRQGERLNKQSGVELATPTKKKKRKKEAVEAGSAALNSSERSQIGGVASSGTVLTRDRGLQSGEAGSGDGGQNLAQSASKSALKKESSKKLSPRETLERNAQLRDEQFSGYFAQLDAAELEVARLDALKGGSAGGCAIGHGNVPFGAHRHVEDSAVPRIVIDRETDELTWSHRGTPLSTSHVAGGSGSGSQGVGKCGPAAESSAGGSAVAEIGEMDGAPSNASAVSTKGDDGPWRKRSDGSKGETASGVRYYVKNGKYYATRNAPGTAKSNAHKASLPRTPEGLTPGDSEAVAPASAAPAKKKAAKKKNETPKKGRGKDGISPEQEPVLQAKPKKKAPKMKSAGLGPPPFNISGDAAQGTQTFGQNNFKNYYGGGGGGTRGAGGAVPPRRNNEPIFQAKHIGFEKYMNGVEWFPKKESLLNKYPSWQETGMLLIGSSYLVPNRAWKKPGKGVVPSAELGGSTGSAGGSAAEVQFGSGAGLGGSGWMHESGSTVTQHQGVLFGAAEQAGHGGLVLPSGVAGAGGGAFDTQLQFPEKEAKEIPRWQEKKKYLL